MTHIFISYSKKNRVYARTLADHLLSLGFNVWIDDRIDYGEMWERTIFKAIDDCSAFLIIMTPDSYQSDWVLREIQYADRRHKPQFPVLLDGEDFPRYGPHQHVDVRGGLLPPEDFYERLARAAPRKAKTGTNVTPQDIAVPDTDTLPATPAASIIPPTRNLNTRVIGAIVVGIFALLMIGLVLLNRPSKTDEQVQTLVVETATLRQEVTRLSTVLTAEATQQMVSVPSLTITRTPTQSPSKTPTLTQTAAPSPTRTPTITLTATPAPSPTSTATTTPTRTPTITPTIDIIMAVNTLDAEATIHVRETNQAATVTERAARTATAASWTDTPTPTATLTPNITASIEAFLTQRAAQTATAIAAFKTATADSWTDTPTPTATFTNTPTATATFTPTPTATFTPTPTPTALGGGPGQIVFSSNRDGNYEIYVMNPDGSNLRRLTDSNAVNYFPTWSPDGSQIVFNSDRNGNHEIYVMNADGSNPRNLTNNVALDYAPSWSPDSKNIVFYSRRDGNREIYVMNVDGSNLRRLTNNATDDYSPAWSPDSKNIVFYSTRDGNREIYVMNADGSNPRNLTNNATDDYSPVWSPDGKQITFSSNRDENAEIYVMNADGSNPRNLTNNATDDNYPKWRPAAPNPDPLLNVPVIENVLPESTVEATAEAANTSTQVGKPTLTLEPVIIRITGNSRVNVRKGPGSNYAILSSKEPGTTFIARRVSTDGRWVYIGEFDYSFGWVSTEFIRVTSGDYDSLPRSNQ